MPSATFLAASFGEYSLPATITLRYSSFSASARQPSVAPVGRTAYYVRWRVVGFVNQLNLIGLAKSLTNALHGFSQFVAAF